MLTGRSTWSESLLFLVTSYPCGLTWLHQLLQRATVHALSCRRYFCNPGAVTPTQNTCGNASVFCPAGSGYLMVAEPGVFTIGPAPELRNGTQPCPSGSYCVEGVKLQCPPGQFGCATRLSSATCNGLCTAGFYCPAESTSSQAYVWVNTPACMSSSYSWTALTTLTRSTECIINVVCAPQVCVRWQRQRTQRDHVVLPCRIGGSAGSWDGQLLHANHQPSSPTHGTGDMRGWTVLPSRHCGECRLSCCVPVSRPGPRPQMRRSDLPALGRRVDIGA
jgi:hypothetical protein